MNKKPLISYILPTYQAESFIYDNLDVFFKYCSESRYDTEIIVVNDGSSDKSGEIIRSFINEKEERSLIKYIDVPVNRGKGAAVKKGFEISIGDYVVFTDCDLPYSFDNIDDVVDRLVKGDANIAIACRMHKESVYKIKSENLSYIYIRHTSGRVYNWFIKYITQLDIEDTQAGLKGFDRETAELVFGKSTIEGFSFDIDLLVCAAENHKTIVTVPIDFNYETEMSTINFVRQIFLMTMGLLKVFIKKRKGLYAN